MNQQHDNAKFTGLWSAVILQTLKDCLPVRQMTKGVKPTDKALKERERVRDQAIEWLDSQDERPQSFLWVCEMLGHPAESIRAYSVRLCLGEREAIDRLRAFRLDSIIEELK